MRRSLLTALAATLLLASPAAAQSPDVVISQVYGGGGNAGAPLANDYVELFNRGAAPVDVTGWSVQYASAAGTSWTNRTPLTGTLEPGRFLLVRGAAGSSGGAPLPEPDVSGSINLSATAGKVALVTSADALDCGGECAGDPRVRDFVGYGATASDHEGPAPAPTASNTTALSRAQSGCQDTDANAADFAAGPPGPRSSRTDAAPCGGDAAPFVAGSSPSDGAADVPLDASIDVTFSEPVTADPGAFSLACAGGGARPVTVTGGPTIYTVDPSGALERGETCTVTVAAGGVRDQDSDDPPDTLAGDATLSFTTVGLELRIHEIQGAGHVSPYLDRAVSGVPGVVTARRSNGFYLQDPRPDRDEETSEGIFVFTGGAPPATAAVGAAVRVSGRVDEFRAVEENLSITQIVRPAVTAAGSGAVRPTVVGRGGRIPPRRVIDDDSSGDVDTTSCFDPREDGIDFHESLEGMLVRIRHAVAVGPTSGFGETAVVGDRGRFAGPRTRRGGVVVTPHDFNPERLILDDVLAPDDPANVGDTFAEPIDAVVDYSFGNFKYLPLATPVRVDRGLRREVTEAPRRDELAVASFNVENLDPGDPPEKFAALAEVLVDHLRAPDLVAVEEIQDDDGPRNTPSTDASRTWRTLIEAVEAAGGPAYEFRDIDPAPNQDGGEPGGNIRVGFLFRTDRGLEFVDRPGGTATAATRVEETRRGARLTLSPGRIEPTDPAFANSRKPLAAELRWRGRTIFAVANHFNSKGGDDPLFGRVQPPVRSSEEQRHAQARIVNGFARELLAADRDARILVLGDLNDFDFSRTLEILEGRQLVNLMETLPRRERYSYVFDGNSQVLDQILVSRALARPRPEYDSVHVNAEFFDQTSDHDPQVARLRPR